MKRNHGWVLSVLLAFGLGIAPSLRAQEAAAQADKKPSAEVEAKMIETVKKLFPDAVMGEFEKIGTAGTNTVFVAPFTLRGDRMLATVISDGTLLETEEPADIKTFPEAANQAVRRAITQMGVKDNGVRLGRTYAEIQTDETNNVTVVKLPEPLLTYRADVANNHGVPGKYSFKADGTPVEKPSWSQ